MAINPVPHYDSSLTELNRGYINLNHSLFSQKSWKDEYSKWLDTPSLSARQDTIGKTFTITVPKEKEKMTRRDFCSWIINREINIKPLHGRVTYCLYFPDTDCFRITTAIGDYIMLTSEAVEDAFPELLTRSTILTKEKMPSTIKELATFRQYVILLIDGKLCARSTENNSITEADPSGCLLLEEWMFMMHGNILHVGEMKALPTKAQQAAAKRKELQEKWKREAYDVARACDVEKDDKLEAIGKKYQKMLGR